MKTETAVSVGLNFSKLRMVIDANGQHVVLNREQVIQVIEKLTALISEMPKRKTNENQKT